jgi:hypothetical protein
MGVSAALQARTFSWDVHAERVRDILTHLAGTEADPVFARGGFINRA